MPAAALLGQPLAAALPTLEPLISPLLNHVLTTGEPILDVDVRGELPNGNLCRWLVSYYPVATRTGSVIAVECAVHALDQRAPFTALATTQAALYQATNQIAFQATILANLNDAVIAMDLAERITYWGPGAERLYGFSAKEALGRPLGDVIHYQWRNPADDQAAHKALRETGAWRGELRHVQRGGGLLTIAASASTLTNAQGTITGILSVIRDITDHRRAEVALRASEERFRTIQEISLDGVALVRNLRDASGTIVDFTCAYLNPVAERLVGQPLAQVQGQRMAEALPGVVTSGLLARYCQVATSGEPLVFEHHYDADGISAWYRNMVVRMGDGLAIIFSDITRDKRVELEQSHLLAFASALADALTPEQVIAVIFEKVYNVLDAQAGAVAMLGEDEHSVELLRNMVYPPTRDFVKQRIDMDMPFPLVDAIHSGQPVWITDPAEISARYPRLQEFLPEPCACAALPLTIQQRVIGGLGMIFANPRDFSPDDKLYLQVIAHQCAQALDRARLYEAERQARLAAEDAVRTRDDLLSLVSHDLRNPLTIILGQAQIMMKQVKRLDDQGQPFINRLSMICDMVGQMNGQLEDLLDVARLRAGQKLILNLQPLDLVALVQEVVKATQATTNRHQIQLTLPDSGILCLGDQRRLMLVCENLLGNAVTYSPAGGPIMVQISSAADEAGTWAVVSVQDSGIGIPAADLPQIFERFYRGDNVAGRIAGTGLGLASARQIVEQHKGRIQVESVEGQGSIFTFYLSALP